MSWEYKVFVLAEAWQSQEAHLNEVGKDSWELVCVSNGRAYLRRQVFDEETTIRYAERRETEEGAELVGHAASACNCGCMAECSC
jgi:hypothetical protein